MVLRVLEFLDICNPDGASFIVIIIVVGDGDDDAQLNWNFRLRSCGNKRSRYFEKLYRFL